MNRTQQTWLEVAASMALCSLLVCCGKTPEAARIPVTGRVTLDGKPLANGSVQFLPRGSIRADATALVVNGEFQLDEHHGPPAGDYDVCVIPAAPEFEEVEAAMRNGAPAPLQRLPIPGKYQEPGILKTTVAKDGGPLLFALTSR